MKIKPFIGNQYDEINFSIDDTFLSKYDKDGNEIYYTHKGDNDYTHEIQLESSDDHLLYLHIVDKKTGNRVSAYIDIFGINKAVQEILIHKYDKCVSNK